MDCPATADCEGVDLAGILCSGSRRCARPGKIGRANRHVLVEGRLELLHDAIGTRVIRGLGLNRVRPHAVEYGTGPRVRLIERAHVAPVEHIDDTQFSACDHV